MSLSSDNIKSVYPLPAYNFKVRLGAETYSFSKVSGLNIRFDTITYRHGLSWLEGETHLPGIQQPVNIVLERGVVAHNSVLLEWIQSIKLGSVVKQDVYIDLCDEKGEPSVSWSIRNAFPTQFEAPDFDSSTNEVAIERLHLMGNGFYKDYLSATILLQASTSFNLNMNMKVSGKIKF